MNNIKKKKREKKKNEKRIKNAKYYSDNSPEILEKSAIKRKIKKEAYRMAKLKKHMDISIVDIE